VGLSTTSNAGSGGGGGGATLQLSCTDSCTVRGCNFTANTAPQANGGGFLANVSAALHLYALAIVGQKNVNMLQNRVIMLKLDLRRLRLAL